MAVILEDKNRDYKRIRPSPAEKMKLRNAGLQWTLSSNISAVGVVDNDLIIRFHNGSLYKYPNNAEHFAPMLNSNSKGKYFWRKLRRPGASYIKIGSLPLPEDTTETDEEVMTQRIATHIVKAIVPTTEQQMQGVLPSISISPIASLIGSNNDFMGNILTGLFISSF